jgi:hypothetical protein
MGSCLQTNTKCWGRVADTATVVAALVDEVLADTGVEASVSLKQ